MESYILSNEESKYLGYIGSNDQKQSYESKIIADTVTVWFLDCEMIQTTLGTEVALIGYGKKNTSDKINNSDKINSSDTYESRILRIKPKGEIIDYITPITGLDKNSIFDLTLEEAINILLFDIHKNDIIIGHHLYIDLNALNIYHPRVIDCAMIFHHPDGPPYYYSLKELVATYLKRDIQTGAHNPVEDGIASYELIQMCINNGYIKTHWKFIGEKFIPSVELVSDALNISQNQITNLYTRGSRAIGTNSPNSDYDLIVVLKEIKIINGTLTRYGNIDICSYDTEYFEQMLRDNIIWAIEAIYCPDDLILCNLVDYRVFYEKYRINNRSRSNEKLRQSIGYESSRKMASAKKHFNRADYNRANKHVFIGIRFVDFGRQIVKYNKIQDIRASNYIFDMLNKCKKVDSYAEFKALWFDLYVSIYREFSSLAPKPVYSKLEKSFMFPEYIKHKNLNVELHVLKVIQNSETDQLLDMYPEYNEFVKKVNTTIKDFEEKVKGYYDNLIMNCDCKDKKVFATLMQQYDRIFHKYLFFMYDKKDYMKIIQTKRLYADLFHKEKKRIVNNYGFSAGNKYGLYADYVNIWEKEQLDNSKKVIQTDQFDINSIILVGGLDISFDPSDDTKGCAYITIYNMMEKKIVYEDHLLVKLDIPYISGYLGYREIPAYKELLIKIKQEKPDFYPDVLMVDGFGILHYREFGSASHIGLEMNLPSIGVAKTLLCIFGFDEHTSKYEFRKKCKNVGDSMELVGDNKKIYGVAYKSAKDTMNPIYISIGHMISLESAITIVNQCTKFRIPEPIRNSDIKSKLFM
jgi:deoxyinosine 3'endonuclease (endonuclease V)